MNKLNEFQVLQSNIELLYMRLSFSMLKIVSLVEDEIDFKGLYNPKKHKIVECDNISEFQNFQSLMRGLNNYVYYNSLILSSYSIFEYAMKSICYFINDHLGFYKKFDDKPIYILENCISYVKGTQLVDFKEKELDKIYMQIKNVNKLRNLITHFNGNLFKDKSKPLGAQTNYNLFKSDKRLIITSNGQVYIDDSDYIISFIENSEKFLKLIIEKLTNKC